MRRPPWTIPLGHKTKHRLFPCLLVAALVHPSQAQESASPAYQAPKNQASHSQKTPTAAWKNQAWNKALQRGRALAEEGRYLQAENSLVEALKRAERFGLSDPRVAACLNDLAHFYQARGNREAAEPLYLRTIKILESSLGPRHVETGNAWLNLAEFYRGADRFSEAEPAYERWMQSLETSFAANQASLISPIKSLALIYSAIWKAVSNPRADCSRNRCPSRRKPSAPATPKPRIA